MENQIKIMEENAALFSFSNVNFFTGTNILPDDQLEKLRFVNWGLKILDLTTALKVVLPP